MKNADNKTDTPHAAEQYGWGANDCALLSELALAKIWLNEEEDEAWAEYQPTR